MGTWAVETASCLPPLSAGGSGLQPGGGGALSGPLGLVLLVCHPGNTAQVDSQVFSLSSLILVGRQGGTRTTSATAATLLPPLSVAPCHLLEEVQTQEQFGPQTLLLWSLHGSANVFCLRAGADICSFAGLVRSQLCSCPMKAVTGEVQMDEHGYVPEL